MAAKEAMHTRNEAVSRMGVFTTSHSLPTYSCDMAMPMA